MTKHPDCAACDCGMGDEHCKHAHLPWGELTDVEMAVLDFEAQRWAFPGAKEQAIQAVSNRIASFSSMPSTAR